MGKKVKGQGRELIPSGSQTRRATFLPIPFLSYPCQSVSIRGKLLLFVSAALWLLASVASAAAHPPLSAIAFVKVEPGGRMTVTLVHDSLAFALNDTSMAI